MDEYRYYRNRDDNSVIMIVRIILMSCKGINEKNDNRTSVFASSLINDIEGFWSFAKERFMKYHGVDPMKFPLYQKELEFRNNHRNRDLFNGLLQALVGYSLVA